MKIILFTILILCLASAVFADPIVTVTQYTIDSTPNRDYSPLAIPRFQMAPLSDRGDLVIYMAAGFPTTRSDFYVTLNPDSSTRWVCKYTGINYPLDHGHISVYNDTVYLGKTGDYMYAFGMTGGDSLTQLFTYDWGATEQVLYIASVWRLPGSDTAIAVTRGYSQPNANNIMYYISANRGQSWSGPIRMADWSSLGSRVRIGGLIYNNTLAIAADSNDQAIVWFTWDRATRSWVNEGHVFNRAFYRAYAGNAIEDTIRFVMASKDTPSGDSVICAYKNKGAAGWTEGPGFVTSPVAVAAPPHTAMTYIESSKRLVLFYTKSDYAVDDSIDVYMRYWKNTEKAWSAPVKVSRGKYSCEVVTACRVPVSHGDVCYVTYSMDSTIGGTVYHYADLAKVSFQSSGDTIPPGRINDLSAEPGPEMGQVRLAWTAPGDDEYDGTADQYVVKYSQISISEQNFDDAISFNYPPIPSMSGEMENCIIGGLQSGKKYYFAAKSIDTAGNISPLSNIAIIETPVDVAVDESSLPLKFVLLQNYPNPFNNSTWIKYNIPTKSHIHLSVYDLLGQKINTLVNQPLAIGNYSSLWDSKDDNGMPVASGVYFCRMETYKSNESRKMLLLK
jgi:hypothetical protein